MNQFAIVVLSQANGIMYNIPELRKINGVNGKAR